MKRFRRRVKTRVKTLYHTDVTEMGRKFAADVVGLSGLGIAVNNAVSNG